MPDGGRWRACRTCAFSVAPSLSRCLQIRRDGARPCRSSIRVGPWERHVPALNAQGIAWAMSTTGRISMVPSIRVTCGHVLERVWMAFMFLPSKRQYPLTKLA